VLDSRVHRVGCLALNLPQQLLHRVSSQGGVYHKSMCGAAAAIILCGARARVSPERRFDGNSYGRAGFSLCVVLCCWLQCSSQWASNHRK
jgi:hypothetical protein